MPLPTSGSGGAIDALVHLAAQYHQHLDVTVSDQNGTCDNGQQHTVAWYQGGFRTNEPGPSASNTTSYAQWVTDVVQRYRLSPAVAMWEPVNEEANQDPWPCVNGKTHATTAPQQ